MNIIVNLSHINNREMLNRYALKIDNANIITKIISQVSLEDTDNILFLVNPGYENDVEFLLHDFSLKDFVSTKTLTTAVDNKIASGLFSHNFNQIYQTMQTSDLRSFFGDALNVTDSVVLIEGKYLYKKSILNFESCDVNTLITFETKEQDFSSSYMMFLNNLTTIPEADIKSVIINDYKYNYLEMQKIKTIIQSSQAFSNNRELRYEYLMELFSKFEFSLALEQIKEVSGTNIHWLMLYFEFLEGFGYEEQFIELYQSNKMLIDRIQLTETQKQMYEPTFKLFKLFDSDQVLVNNDLKDYLMYGNTDFDFVTDSITKSNAKQFNLSYLLNDMIVMNTLEEYQALRLLELMERFEVNPYIKMKNVVDMSNYFISPKLINTISHELINTLFSKLHENQELFIPGLREIKEKYNKILNINSGQNISISPYELNHIPINKGKVAVCITGLAKYNYEKNLELINYFMGDLDADFFIQMWNVYEEYPALSEFGADNDNDWSQYYMGIIRKLLPTFIKRQANFEALLPNTSKLLFTKKFSAISKGSYTDVLGEKVKAIKMYDYSKFNESQDVSSSFDNLKTRMIKYFERYKVTKILEKYILDNNSSYEYVINIDINTMLKSKVKYHELQLINDNEVHVLNSEHGKLGIGMTVANIQTSFKLNKMWEFFQAAKNLTPFVVDGKPTLDKNQDSMLMYLLSSRINWYEIKSNLGAPYINKKIKLPKMMDLVQKDIANFEGDVDPIIKYFSEADRIFTVDFKNNTRYQSITKVELIKHQITESGIEINLSVKGTNLKSLPKNLFHLHGESEVELESTLARPKIYKQSVEFLKYDDDEIVIRKIISEDDLYIGKAWKFTLLYHDYTLTNIAVEYDHTYNNVYELNKYGMKYISFEDRMKLGVATKSFFLK
ncbi:hypothetical protein RZE82_03360 [Mollicutes bacterium LVI A0039]|nr:hypothetical protein RZE82_03360 [Mollicutes bacterium LVI A0039]